MVASASSYNRVFSKIQSSFANAIETNNTNILGELFDFKLSENVKCYIEAACRDFVLKKICANGKADLEQVKFIVKVCINGVRLDLCLPTLPIFILSDVFDCITIQQCEELFEFIESNVSVLKEDLFFSLCKNQVLRMCNDVLRRLSRSQNTIFCGRILLFLARFFPFSERSGLNLISEFNLENVTVFTDTEVSDMELGENIGEEKKESRPSLDYTLYTKFWALQDFFRNPSQCFQKSPWKLFTKYADDILEAFLSFKLDNVEAVKSSEISVSKDMVNRQTSVDQDDQYFPKFLTNQKLLDLQFSDSNFRRYILVQMLILSQYLTSTTKFKQDTLSEDQAMWVKKMQEKCFSLLAETPSNGKEFVEIVKAILKREEIWSEWKNNGCPEIKKPGTSLKRKSEAQVNGKEESDAEFTQPRKKEKVKLGDIIKDADSKHKYVMGNAEMTRLWNICPNNMEACRQGCRDFVPSLESYFAKAIEQVLSKVEVKDENKLVNDSNFGWRGLRLLAINEDEDDDKEEEIGVLEQNEGVKEVEEDDDDDDDNPREELKPIDEEERKLLAKAFSADSNKEAWKTLGKKLGFEEDELIFFESESKNLACAVEIMFDRWVENDREEANKENLIYTLEGLKMDSIIQKVTFISIKKVIFTFIESRVLSINILD
ncbi:THO complex subunit 1 [Armadillidium nasatum]|uniref:THO complex subunit 1 n=1 Tax=Armadillidium nasatum TaxID=96803 RepID=A0A5N5TCA4_9CRUS|nr:THO complex subunit 1 [Armadillidium nasatum]